MDARPIRNEEDYGWALREVEPYFDAPPAPGTHAADRFDVLVSLISRYEAEHHPVPASDPIDLLHFAIEDMGRSRAELADVLGSHALASGVLERKRRLTVEMVHAIAEAWCLPADVLVQPYDLAEPTAA